MKLRKNKCAERVRYEATFLGFLVNAVTLDGLGKLEYIELKGDPNCFLGGNKICLIKPYTTPPSIEMVITLQTSYTNPEGYFIIGGDGVVNGETRSQMLFTSTYVKHKSKLLKGATRSIMDMFNDGGFKPIGLVLLSFQGRERIGFSEIMLTDASPVLKINEEIKKVLAQTLKDALVYSTKGSGDSCTIFDELIPEWTGKKYVLREFNLLTTGRSGSNDLSLSNCGEVLQSPWSWRLGQKTPMKDNDCSGVNFIMEFYAAELFNQVGNAEVLDDPEFPDADRACSSTYTPGDYATVSREKIDKMVQTEMKRFDIEETSDGVFVSIMYPDNDQIDGRLQERIDRWRNHAASEDIEDNPILPWEDLTKFNEGWMNLIKNDKPIQQLMPDYSTTANANALKDLKSWFEWLPALKRYRCRICHSIKNAKNPTSLAADNGVMLATKKKNQEKIREHSKKAAHLSNIEVMKIRHTKVLEKKLEDQRKKNDINSLNYATAMRFLDAFSETKLNIAFSKHERMMEWFDARGIDSGKHHRDQTSVKNMVVHMSIEFLKILNSSLLKDYSNDPIPEKFLQAKPISLLLDGSTDSAGNHVVLLMFQAVENDRVVVYFYRALQLGVDESSQGQVNAVVKVLKEDGLYDYFKENLIGVGTDGASVMAGAGIKSRAAVTSSTEDEGPLQLFNENNDNEVEGGGFTLLLAKELGRSLFSMKCMPHTLHLAIKWAFDDIPYMDLVEDRLNGLHNFYNNRMHKVKAHMRELCEILGTPAYSYNYLHKIRWISSERDAVDKVVKSLFELNLDLESISQDNALRKHQARATGMRTVFSGRLFVMMIHFLCDLLNVLARYSEIFQGSGGTLIGKQSAVNNLLSNIETLRTTPGIAMSKLLNNCQCYKDILSVTAAKKCGVKEYETYGKVVYHDNVLDSEKQITLDPTDWKDYDAGKTKFSTLRVVLCNALKSQIMSYFPDDVGLSNFDIFLPEKIPKASDANTYGNAEIEAISKLLKLDPDRTVSEWHKLLDDVRETGHLSVLGKKKEAITIRNRPHVFWQTVLRSTMINWNGLKMIKRLLRSVLVLPSTTADVERTFSTHKFFRYDKRNRLTTETMDHLLRIYVNGPKISDFNPFRYARSWLLAGNWATDSPKTGRGKGKNPFMKE